MRRGDKKKPHEILVETGFAGPKRFPQNNIQFNRFRRAAAKTANENPKEKKIENLFLKKSLNTIKEVEKQFHLYTSP